MNNLISIVVPVYKVEAYLDKCIQSIVDQTYQNLEIILVDDGSPDRCGEMCDAWAARDSRIQVIHKENGGLSDARNAGLAVATGQYMGFVDSDDYIAPDMYRLLLERMAHDSSDISACGVEMVWEDDTPRQMLTPGGCHILDNAQAMEAIIRESLLKHPVWYKLYKTDLIRDIPFAVGKYHEDVFWSWQAIARAGKVSIIDTPCYFYLQRGNSIMGSGFSEKRLDSIEAKCIRQDYLMKHYPALAEADRCALYFSCMYLGQQAVRALPRERLNPVLAYLNGVLERYPVSRETVKSQTLPHRGWLLLAGKSLKQTCRLRNRLKIGL